MPSRHRVDKLEGIKNEHCKKRKLIEPDNGNILLAVILVSGFIYVNLSLSTRYRYKRSNGWDAYFLWLPGVSFFSPWRFFTFILNVSGGFRWLANALNLTPDSFNGMLSSSKDKLSKE